MSFVPEFQSSDANALFAPDYLICNFQSEKKFFFSLDDARMKFRTRTRILFGMKTLIPEWPVLVQYHVNNYREIHGDGMNSNKDAHLKDVKITVVLRVIHKAELYVPLGQFIAGHR